MNKLYLTSSVVVSGFWPYNAQQNACPASIRSDYMTVSSLRTWKTLEKSPTLLNVKAVTTDEGMHSKQLKAFGAQVSASLVDVECHS